MTLLILAAGLSFGVQVLRWWKETPLAPDVTEIAGSHEKTKSPENLAGSRSAFLETEWGGLNVVTLVGEEKEVHREVAEICLAVAERKGGSPGSVTEEERRLLERLAGTKPVRSSPRGVEVYQCPGELPMWAMVRSLTAPGVHSPKQKDAPHGTATENAGEPRVSLEGEGRVDSPHHRVVGWGVLIPAGAKLWTLYIHIPSRSMPIPEASTAGADNRSSLRTTLEGALKGVCWVAQFSFSPDDWVGIFEEAVAGASASWRTMIDEKLAEQHWRSLGQWRQSGEEIWKQFSRSGAQEGEEFLSVRLRFSQLRPARGLAVYVRSSKQPSNDGKSHQF